MSVESGPALSVIVLVPDRFNTVLRVVTELARQEIRDQIVAFVEDHCFPTPGWAEALLRAHERAWAGVGPVVLNANPKRTLSWANLLIEYGPWLHPRERGTVSHIPGHNSSYSLVVLME